MSPNNWIISQYVYSNVFLLKWEVLILSSKIVVLLNFMQMPSIIIHTHIQQKQKRKNGAYILISRGHIHLINYECFCFIIFVPEISKTNLLN